MIFKKFNLFFIVITCVVITRGNFFKNVYADDFTLENEEYENPFQLLIAPSLMEDGIEVDNNLDNATADFDEIEIFHKFNEIVKSKVKLFLPEGLSYLRPYQKEITLLLVIISLRYIKSFNLLNEENMQLGGSTDPHYLKRNVDGIKFFLKNEIIRMSSKILNMGIIVSERSLDGLIQHYISLATSNVFPNYRNLGNLASFSPHLMNLGMNNSSDFEVRETLARILEDDLSGR